MVTEATVPGPAGVIFPRLALGQVEGPAAADVLASLGHELRAPLASLRATLELLDEQPSDSAILWNAV